MWAECNRYIPSNCFSWCSLLTVFLLIIESLATLFRANSIMTKAYDLYFKMTGQFYLSEMLQDVIDQIYEPSTIKDCELNPKFLSKPEKAASNAAHVQAYADKLLSRMYKNIQAVPVSFRHIFNQLRIRLLEKFPECKSQNAFYTSISAFLFLRFVCPAILNPKIFKLRAELPPTKANRSLTILAKLVQSIANLIPFGEKEPYMMVLNDYHSEQMPKFMAFINKMTVVSIATSYVKLIIIMVL